MMIDRLLAWFHRASKPAKMVDNCCEDPEKGRKRMVLERREQEARRMNDALEDIVHTMRQDGS